MTLISRRVPLVALLGLVASPGRTCSQLARLCVTVLLALGLVVTASACGMNVQTNKPYTPADGVNLDVGPIHVRNLMILSKATGEGILSASLVSPSTDALTGVAGNPIKVDGTNGATFTVTVPDPVAIGNNTLVVLTDHPFITLKSDDLVPGLTAKLVLQFSSAGQTTVLVPIVDANQPDYATITPTPSALP